MKTNKDFSSYLQDFFTNYLVRERACSVHTIKAYRDSFVLLIDFLDTKRNIKPDKITFAALNREIIQEYLCWLEEFHHNSIRSRNNRLAAVKSFFKFMMYEDPTMMEKWKSICSIPAKKGKKGSLNYLTTDGIKSILEQVNTDTDSGVRDLTLLSLLYSTGARVQELIDLTPLSIRKEKPYVVTLFGKGSKMRQVPIEESLLELIKKYMNIYKLNQYGKENHPLFYNVWGEKLTNAGITYIIKKYSSMARILNPDIIPEKISPHVFRHSRAMHLLQAGVNLVYIRDILGHVSIQTTEIYARADSKHKREALEKAYESIGLKEPEVKPWIQNPKLIEMLKGICE